MYIDSGHKLFAHLDRLAGWQNGEKPAPVTVEWDLSNRCVLGCQDCHFAHTHVKGPWASKKRMLPMAFDGTGDLADVDLVKRGLEEMKAAGVQGIIWSGGGEPTTHPQWPEIVQHAAFTGLKQGMYTLGGLLTDPQRAKHLADNLEWVVVSLDCLNAGTYAREKQVPEHRFEEACTGIRNLAMAGSTIVGISFLLHEENWYDAERMATLGRRLGANYISFRPMIQVDASKPAVPGLKRAWINDALPTLRRLHKMPDVEMELKRFLQYRDWVERSYKTCYGIRLNATVTPDGRVWVCPQRRGVQGSSVGDLSKESFTDLWQRHVGQWTNFSECRVMCRLHNMNETLSVVYGDYRHEAFL